MKKKKKKEALTIRQLERLDSGASKAIYISGSISCNGQEDIKNYIDSLPSKYGGGGDDKYIVFDFLVNSGSFGRALGYMYPTGSYAAYVMIYYYNLYLCMKRDGQWVADKNM